MYREQLITLITSCSEQEQEVNRLMVDNRFPEKMKQHKETWYHIAIQKIQQNAVTLDNCLELYDSKQEETVLDSDMFKPSNEYKSLVYFSKEPSILDEATVLFSVFDKAIEELDANTVEILFPFYAEELLLNPPLFYRTFLKIVNSGKYLAVGSPLSEIYKLFLQVPAIDPSINNYELIRVALQHNHHSVAIAMFQKLDNRISDTAMDTFVKLFCNKCFQGSYDIVSYMMKYIVDPADGENNDAIEIASFKGHLEIVELLLSDPRVDPSQNANNSLMDACAEGHLPVVERLLLDPRINPANYNNIAIFYAVSMGHLPIIDRLLLDPRVNQTVNRNELLEKGAKEGHLPIVERMLSVPNLVISNTNTALCGASYKGCLSIVDLLLKDARIDPNLPLNLFGDPRFVAITTTEQEKYKTALGYACEEGRLEIVERLLADPRVDPSIHQNLALQIACKTNDRHGESDRDYLAIINRLLQDSRVNPADNKNRALNLAIREGRILIAERLLQDPRVDPFACKEFSSQFGYNFIRQYIATLIAKKPWYQRVYYSMVGTI
jgi:Ankyrin repeats (3 copies)